ncbi:protein E6C [Equid gammaherpesvirus 5]|nr:protein E6C [Equid gammaherpesvirus 5]
MSGGISILQNARVSPNAQRAPQSSYMGSAERHARDGPSRADGVAQPFWYKIQSLCPHTLRLHIPGGMRFYTQSSHAPPLAKYPVGGGGGGENCEGVLAK